MSAIREFFQNQLLAIPPIGFMDVFDILVVAFLFYTVLRLIRSTSAARVARAILLLLAVTWLTGLVHMYTLNWILNKILELGIIALVIMFQPELRRGLERVGGKFMLHLSDNGINRSTEESAIEATVKACETMSRERIGVLIVFERESSLEDYIRKGTPIDAKVTEQLLRSLFYPNTSLHDGAVIIRNGRIAAAGCVMPLSSNDTLSSDLGTRHRAGIGTSEEFDAVSVIVSEETGTISVAVNGMLKRHLAPQTLEKLLSNELLKAEDTTKLSLIETVRGVITKRTEKHEDK